MKAMRYHGFGSPELLREDNIASPKAGKGEVLIDIAASSINPADWKIGEGALRGMIDLPLPFIPGMDFSGVVAQVGPGVTDFSVDDHIYGATPLEQLGSFAETIAVSVAFIAKAPKSIALATAAVVPLAALTAWWPIISADYANVQAGQKVLIHGGAGGTGIFAVQFARWRGAHVIATGSNHNQDFLRSLGAHEAIDYNASRFEDVVKEVDAVIDLVGGDVPARSIPLIRSGGSLVSIVSMPNQQLAERHGVRASFMVLPRDRQALTKIAQLIDEGVVRVVVSEEYPLAQAAQALAKNRLGHTRGKILLRVRG